MSGEAICDRHGRTFRYLRIAVTERCNLRCVYCMPEEGVPLKSSDVMLSDREIVRIVSAWATCGVSKIRITGGEPLIRRGLVDLIREIRNISGVAEVHLTSNGLLLEKHLERLVDAGLSGVNISLDTLKPARFQLIARRKGLDRALAAIDAALASGLSSVKVNVVAMRGFNDDELVDFARMTLDRDLTVRFIELMPFDADQVWKRGRYLGQERIIEALTEAFPGYRDAEGSATEGRCVQLPGGQGRVAVIPAYSRSMCATCDRIRLTADGKILNCLFSEREFDVRDVLRSGASDEQLVAVLREAMGQKLVDGWEAQRESDGDGSTSRESMTQIGG